MKLLLFDLDGTLLRSDKTISQRTRDTLEKCRKKGSIIGISTSRALYNCMAFFPELEPDLVIMDITMPNMDGIEALKEIRAYDPQAKVVMLTAAGQQSKIVEAVKSGAAEFITKPFEKDEVLRTLAEITK